MAKNFSMAIKLAADVKGLQKGLKQGQNSLNAFKGYIGTAFSLTAIAAFGSKLLTVTGDFENAMARVKAISGASAEDFKLMSDAAKQMGSSTQYSATQAAEALQYLTMAGLSASESTKALPGVLQLAAAGALDLATSADIATNVMSGFGMSVESLTLINDLLAKTATSANTNVLELGEAMKNAAPVAKLMGVSINDVSKLLAVMANAGIKGGEAGTSLRASFLRLSKPTKEVSDGLDKVGLNVKDVTKYINNGDILGFFDKLRAEMSKMSSADRGAVLNAIFGKNHAGSIGAIIGETQTNVNKLSASIDNYEGSAKKMAKDGMGAWRKATTSLTSAFEGLLIKLGESGVLGAATDFVNMLTSIVRAGVPVLKTIGSLAAGFGVYKVALIASSTSTSAFTTITTAARAAIIGLNMAIKANPIGLLLGTLTAVVGLLWSFKDSLDESANSYKNLNAQLDTSTRRMDNLFRLLNNVNSSEETRKYAIKQINELYGEYLPNLLTENNYLENSAKYHKLAAQALKNNILQKRRASEESEIYTKSIEKEEETLDDFFSSIKSQNTYDNVKASYQGIVEQVIELKKTNQQVTPTITAWANEMGLSHAQAMKYIPRIAKLHMDEAKALEVVADKYERVGQAQGATTKQGPKLLAIPELKFDEDEIDDLDLEITNASPKLLVTPEFKFEEDKIDDLDISDLLSDSEIAMTEYNEQMKVATERGKLFQNSSAALAEQMDLTESAIMSLTRDGLTEQNWEIQVLIEQLNKLKSKYQETAQTMTLFGETVDISGNERLLKLSEKLREQGQQVTGLNMMYQDLGESLSEMAAEGAESFQEMGKALGNTVRSIIKALIAQGVAGAVSNALKDAPWPVGLIAAPLAATAATTLFNTVIPAFANGGVLTGPTVGLMGEYPSAKFGNPEIVTPQKIMAETFSKVLKSNGGAGNGGHLSTSVRGDQISYVLDNHGRKKEQFG